MSSECENAPNQCQPISLYIEIPKQVRNDTLNRFCHGDLKFFKSLLDQ
jgi:hypothetical protein